MEQVFSYIISLGASVMMPILFTIIGLCIGLKFGKSLKSGLYVGVGFVGLGIVTALLTNNFGGPLSDISKLYDLQLGVFDMGWPAAAAVAYNTAVGALIIPICLGAEVCSSAWPYENGRVRGNPDRVSPDLPSCCRPPTTGYRR